MIDEIKWSLGDIVYSVLSERRGIITGILCRMTGYTYLVTWQDSDNEAYCYECELSSTPIKEWEFSSSKNDVKE